MFPAADEPALQEIALNLKPPAIGGNVKLAAFFPPAGSAVQLLCSQGEEPVVCVEPVHHREPQAGLAVAGKRFVLRRGEEYR
jgi:hypothetical protein